MESPDAATPTTSAADETRLQHNSEVTTQAHSHVLGDNLNPRTTVTRAYTQRNETPQFSLTQEELSGSVKRVSWRSIKQIDARESW